MELIGEFLNRFRDTTLEIIIRIYIDNNIIYYSKSYAIDNNIIYYSKSYAKDNLVGFKLKLLHDTSFFKPESEIIDGMVKKYFRDKKLMSILGE